MITAHGKEETERIAQERGAWAYVEKPFIIDKIKQLLRDVLPGGTVPNLNLSYSPG
jgi:DNA-binding NtrC family response regulator